VLLIILRKAMVQEKTIDQLDSLEHVLACLGALDLVF